MADVYFFELEGISCTSCTDTIETLLNHAMRDKKIDGTISASFLSKRARLTIDNATHKQEEVIQLVVDTIGCAGFQASYLPSPHQPTRQLKSKKKPSGSKIKLAKGFIGITFGIALMLCSICGLGIPFLACIMIGSLSTLLTLYLGYPFYIDALKKLFYARTLTMDTLFTISSFAAIAVSITAIFVPWLPMMFDAGLLIFGFRYIGDAIKEKIDQKISSNETFQDRLPLEVTVLKNGHEVRLKLSEVLIGDLIKVKGGDIIPIDGLCCHEEADIYKTIINGNPFYQSVRKDEPLYSGMRVAEHINEIHILTTATANTSYLARLDQSILDAETKKAPLQNSTDLIMQFFIPSILLLAFVSATLISVFFTPALAIQCAIAILVSACPCTLGLIVPLGIQIGHIKGSDHGIQFKSAASLQTAAHIDTVVFDLNGTLTIGKPIVKEFHSINGFVEITDVFGIVDALEAHSNHSHANAVRHYVQKQKDFRNHLQFDKNRICKESSGVRTNYENHEWMIGNGGYMQRSGVLLPDLNLQAAQHIIYVAKEKVVIGYFTLMDPLRSDAYQVVSQLKREGKNVHLCTGADLSVARYYADILGIAFDHIAANCVAENAAGIEDQLSKKAYLQRLKAQGKIVAMVGDAGNDAPAMAISDLGIAIQSNASDVITQEQAGIVLQNESLQPIPTAFSIAQQTTSNIKQNLGFSLTYNSIALLIAGGLLVGLGFTLNPGIGVALMVFQTCLILLNVYRFKCQPVRLEQNSSQFIISNDNTMSSSYSLSRLSSSMVCGQGIQDEPQYSDMYAKIQDSQTMPRRALQKQPDSSYFCS